MVFRGLKAAVVLGCLSCCLARCAALGADWPTWRYDANRSAATPDGLPAELHLKWVREFPAPRPAWPAQPRLQFDLAYQPVVAGKTMFLGLNRNDKVVALDTETGDERWSFYAGGPIRFAPVVWRGRTFVAADDGYLYCLDAADGALLWKFYGGPYDRRVMGNERLISMWPARGGPVVADGKVYFAAGVWPFMGVFIHALDAETGRPVWLNDSSDVRFGPQPYTGRLAFGGVSPQGYLVAIGDRLLVPSGRARPACFDRATGKYLYHVMGWKFGDWHVSAQDRFYFQKGNLFDLETGVYGYRFGPGFFVTTDKRGRPVHTPERLYTIERPNNTGDPRIMCYDIRGLTVPPYPESIRKFDYEYRIGEARGALEGLKWEIPVQPGQTLWLKAGPRLYTSKDATVMAIDLPGGQVSWAGQVEGGVGGMIAADDKLFVSTRQGYIYCFAETGGARRHVLAPAAPRAPDDEWSRRAAGILEATGVRDGYCLVLGLQNGRLAEELVRLSALHVIAVDPDAAKVNALCRRLDAAGLYGTRIAVHTGDADAFPFPPYLASLVVSEDIETAGVGGMNFAQGVFRSLRPYGGVACLGLAPTGRSAFAARVRAANLAGAKLRTQGDYTLLVRSGALPGAADWTHEGADAANTAMSKDKLVRLPLGVLWFGGPAGDNIYYNRHTHPPRPQVIGGRLIAQGPGLIHATDIYTGRQLWKTDLPTGTSPPWARQKDVHKRGAAAILGGAVVSAADGIYVRCNWSPVPRRCFRLDPATGRKVQEFTLPGGAAWGYLGIWEDLLIAGASPLVFDGTTGGLGGDPWNASSSARLVVMNRHSGEILWTRDAVYGFRHNAIAMGNGKIFCVDRLPEGLLDRFKRGGVKAGQQPTLLCLDVRTGKVAWSTTQDAAGIYLGYSQKHDILIQALGLTAPGRTGTGVVARRGEDGAVLWRRDGGDTMAPRCMVHTDEVIIPTSWGWGSGYDIRTGAPMGWTYRSSKACGPALAAEHLIVFRSANAAFFDMDNKGGTGNWGGFRSGCSNNLIAAGGVLSAPKFDEDCNCNFPIQTSLALVHMAEVEMWTNGGRRTGSSNIGINLGAPGDRVSREGTFWLDYPSVGGPSPDVPVKIVPDAPQWFRHHSSRVAGGALPWVAASGAKGLASITVGLDGAGPGSATVRLYFAEPDDHVKRGDRVFGVSLQGRQVLGEFDMVREAGGPLREIVKEFVGVKVGSELVVTLTPLRGEPVICGIEVIRE